MTTIYMVWKDTDGKYDILYFKPDTKKMAYLGGQDNWWMEDRYRNRTVEVRRRADLERMSRYLYEQGYKVESQI